MTKTLPIDPIWSPNALELAPAEQVLANGWKLAVTPADTFGSQQELPKTLNWIDARVPGTAASALANAGLYDPEKPASLHDQDIWYVSEFQCLRPGLRRLVFGGLATIAEVYLNGEKVLSSESMFLRHEVTVDVKTSNSLAICFHALAPKLGKKGPRARWKTQLVTSQGLRHFRTTLLGHMPGWCPEVHAVGPWRSISLHAVDAPRLEDLKITADLSREGAGRLDVSFKSNSDWKNISVLCSGQDVELSRDVSGVFKGVLCISDVAAWWPATHGTPTLHDVELNIDGTKWSLGKVGFRRIEVDRGGDGKGFGLQINGVPVFCRGAVWTCADLLGLGSDRETYRSWLEKTRDAGMNMLRIGGTMTYEGTAFFELCDELGILVWQDFQFANFDYPVADAEFAEMVQREAYQQLQKLQGHPSLSVLCGGSEIYQQGAMMGLPEGRWKGELTQTLLPEACYQLRPDVPYVENSPCEGALPFSPNEGIAHFYGVGAYLAPSDDARRANVRFAGECLGFSNVPSRATLDEYLPEKFSSSLWKERIPRDRGTDWDFEDVRDHYLKTLYGVNPETCKLDDPDRYLDLSRAVVAHLLEATFAEWRRGQSSCMGALVWNFQDLLPGAGWGVIDALGRPKTAFHALKRTFQPIQVLLIDEGTNGLQVHLINESKNTRLVELELICLRDGKVPVVKGQREFELSPHSACDFPSTDLFGAFFDTNYAYRFGPPSHDVTVARLKDRVSGECLSETFHFPHAFSQATNPMDVDWKLQDVGGKYWSLSIETTQMLRFVQLEFMGFLPSDDGFHLAPGRARTIHLIPESRTLEPLMPVGVLRALNSQQVLKISV